MKKKLLVIGLSSLAYFASAQTDTTKTTTSAPTDTTNSASLADLDLESLMNVPIVSASREKEDAFDAPVTSYVVTRKEIEKAGSSSIPDALRLCPALFVTEVTNGNFSVDIRGLNNVPAFEYSIVNKTILVMIDNRPVFNQLQGGTSWSNLPVDINDVERIEVVAGPSAALYGPNAVAGAINIITRKLDKKGLAVYSNSMFDPATRSTIVNASVGYKFNDKFSILVSGNSNYRNRAVNDYFVGGTTNDFVTYDQVPNRLVGGFIPYFDRSNLFPNPSLAQNKRGGNIFIDYKVNEKVKFDLSAGIADNNTLNSIGIGNGPVLAYSTANSWYVKSRGEIGGFTYQVSNIAGKQGFLAGVPSYQYDFRTTDVYFDYTYKFKSYFSLRPAISYQNAFISDLPYQGNPYNLPGIFNASAGMYNYAGSLKAEITPIKYIRFVAAVRADRFRYPESKTYVSYEFVLNIKPTENHNIRLVVSRAYQGSYIFPTYVQFNNFFPNKDLDPSKIDLLEAGYRVKINNNFSADLSLFHQDGTSYSQLLADVVLNNAFQPVGANLKYAILPLKTIQNGATISLNSVLWDNKIQFKPFVTLQQTQWQNFSPYSNNPLVIPGFPVGPLNSTNTVNLTSNATPTFYGGFFLNYSPSKKWNFNISSYFFDKYSLYALNEQPSATPSAANPTPTYTNFNSSKASEIKAKFILNAKVSYEIINGFKVFVNARNLSNNSSREFYGSDQIGGMYMIGVNVDL